MADDPIEISGSTGSASLFWLLKLRLRRSWRWTAFHWSREYAISWRRIILRLFRVN